MAPFFTRRQRRDRPLAELFVILNRLSIRAQIDAESEQAVRQLKVVLESGPGS